VYASESIITFEQSSFADNELQGIYAAGGTSTITGCELRGNLGGGFMLRDGHRSELRASFVAQNHSFGVDEAWDCSIDVDSTAVVGNGGSGLVTDYGSSIDASMSSLASNRRYDVLVGTWCVGDTLDARECWWGTAAVPLDSTGNNCGLIWDGVDSPGRAIVQFTPWRTTPAPQPAPVELEPTGGEELAFTTGGGGPGDTLWLELTPQSGTVARFAAVAVGGQLDTLVCILLGASPGGGGPLRGRVVLTASVDLSAPDRLAAATSDQITAWWLADTTVRANMTLPTSPSDPASLLLLVSAYPNPFSSSLSLAWSAPSPAVELSLYDLAGRRLWSRREYAKSGMTVADPRATAALPNGVYMAIVLAGDQRSIVRVVRLR
jgi:hypothetical protein